jgi:hypothetical protein
MSGNDEVDWWAVECSKFGQVQRDVASELASAKVRIRVDPHE